MKTTKKYDFTPTAMAAIKQNKTQKIISVGEDVEKLEPLCTAGGSVKRRHKASSSTMSGFRYDDSK